MKPEIEAYLREHGATYTADALRKELIAAGHDPGEVDAALREWEASRAGAAGAGQESQRTFGRWALWLHLAALVATFLLIVFLNGTESVGIALLSAGVLALFLALGWAISLLIGRALLPRTGLTVALVVPVITALGLGGTCLALADSFIPTPPRPGVVDIQIDPPLSFQGSGAADCFIQPDAVYFSIYANNLGTLEERDVSVSIYSEGGAEPGGPSLNISLNPTSEFKPGLSWSSNVDSQLESEVSEDARTGTITFTNLALEPTEPNPRPDLESISGTVTWTCE